jgi:hypothetical protein
MIARIKELIRDANKPLTPADRHAILDLLEELEAMVVLAVTMRPQVATENS